MKKVYLDDIIREGFIFRDFGKLPGPIMNKICNLPFIKADKPRGVQSSYRCSLNYSREIEKEISDYFIKKINFFVKEDKFLSDSLAYMKVGIDKSVKGDFIMPHTDIEIAGVWQVALFYPYPNDQDFVGRDFIYGTEDNYKSIKPYEGLAVFIDTTQKKYIHAVRELLSDHIFFAVGVNPWPGNRRNENLIKREDLIDSWNVEITKCEMENSLHKK
jgi:hypothetical protein